MKNCLLPLAAVLLLAGCGTTVNTVERAQSQASPNYIADKRVVTDNTLAGTVRVVAINQGTVSGNLLKVQATVENLKNSTKTLNYKFEWTDQNGMAVDSPNETWKQLRIQPRETTTISTVAITPRAVDFTLKLKE
jgi:uncharacterized protein YcfL